MLLGLAPKSWMNRKSSLKPSHSRDGFGIYTLKRSPRQHRMYVRGQQRGQYRKK